MNFSLAVLFFGVATATDAIVTFPNPCTKVHDALQSIIPSIDRIVGLLSGGPESIPPVITNGFIKLRIMTEFDAHRIAAMSTEGCDAAFARRVAARYAGGYEELEAIAIRDKAYQRTSGFVHSVVRGYASAARFTWEALLAQSSDVDATIVAGSPEWLAQVDLVGRMHAEYVRTRDDFAEWIPKVKKSKHIPLGVKAEFNQVASLFEGDLPRDDIFTSEIKTVETINLFIGLVGQKAVEFHTAFMSFASTCKNAKDKSEAMRALEMAFAPRSAVWRDIRLRVQQLDMIVAMGTIQGTVTTTTGVPKSSGDSIVKEARNRALKRAQKQAEVESTTTTNTPASATSRFAGFSWADLVDLDQDEADKILSEFLLPLTPASSTTTTTTTTTTDNTTRESSGQVAETTRTMTTASATTIPTSTTTTTTTTTTPRAVVNAWAARMAIAAKSTTTSTTKPTSTRTTTTATTTTSDADGEWEMATRRTVKPRHRK